ncbi:hypothetical protein KL938_000621 [Ogataea parapolymorpha]|nr:hypothetical protein KL938_000621 [Ogataea parapolymorpha]
MGSRRCQLICKQLSRQYSGTTGQVSNGNVLCVLDAVDPGLLSLFTCRQFLVQQQARRTLAVQMRMLGADWQNETKALL